MGFKEGTLTIWKLGANRGRTFQEGKKEWTKAERREVHHGFVTEDNAVWKSLGK